MEPITFELMLNNVPYWIKAVPFTFNSEARYRVSYNDGPEYIFAWDTNIEQFVAIGDASSTIPDDMEEAVAARLLQFTTEGKRGPKEA
ncbi:hypothetical protein [Chitinophaga japonensis]|uniref:Uncharacterized protein n=1 Tax=Chitinophaga japonensis TaxID=104662 RepID=A0A562T5D9_CHIJA|nr:hypothetical protein [Chitinophaga japonensis]TWI88749.1 hypothetical protein LX66_2835 [Chitinophaga japonensis]